MNISSPKLGVRDRFSRAFLLLLVILGMIYVGMRWSPSSYGVVLTQIEQPAAGLSYGTPRTIRSDEWAVATPILQATIRNEFARHNETSVYHEDLRMMFGLPLVDWGLVFKPTMWGYFIFSAATAFSLHWYLLFAAFVAGYALLFKRMGFVPGQAVALSFGIYFTGFVQFWWNEKGSEFALFPLVVLPLISSGPRWFRLAIFYWLCTSWLLANFYPPVQVSLAFVGAIIVLAYGRDWLAPKRLLSLCFVAALSGITAAWYLRDYLLATSATLYPGHRNLGGGSVSIRQWISQVFPYMLYDWNYNDLTSTNICEAGSVALGLTLMIVVFLRYGQLIAKLSVPSEERWQLAVLACGLGAMTIWMLVPLRPWVGVPLLWNNVQPARMQYAAGILFVMVVCLAARMGGVVLTARRFAVYFVVVLVGWLGLKQVTPDNGLLMSNDLIVLPVMLVLFGVARRSTDALGSLMVASTLSGAIVLFGFNPLQSATPIFEPAKTRVLQELDEEAAMSGGVLAVTGFPGATLNGLGYRSISHTTATPAMAFWRRQYPDMPEAELNTLFNRYSNLLLQERDTPVLLSPDSVGIPLRDMQSRALADFRNPELAASQQPAWLEQGQQMSGTLKAPRTGPIDTFSIEIGNVRNTSDGILTLEICDKTQCQRAQRDLVHSLDNHALPMQLGHALDVNAGDTLNFRFGLAGGSKPLAFWTFTPIDPAAATITLNTVGGPRLPHVRLRYSPEQAQP